MLLLAVLLFNCSTSWTSFHFCQIQERSTVRRRVSRCRGITPCSLDFVQADGCIMFLVSLSAGITRAHLLLFGSHWSHIYLLKNAWRNYESRALYLDLKVHRHCEKLVRECNLTHTALDQAQWVGGNGESSTWQSSPVSTYHQQS